ncbi:MAG: hypothetical protein HQK55_00535 [Deltaproteobacteria bacterium]|nr:hypothetical protein [Deltaproteobacteria bacterium]
MVIDLICDHQAELVSFRVFQGNIFDIKTLAAQIEKIVWEFGCERNTMVDDSSMIQSSKIDDLKEVGFKYITAIAKV